VRDSKGRWLSLQIRSYKNLENRIDGAVLALFDIDGVRRYAQDLRAFCEGVAGTVDEPVVILDLGLRVTMINEAFERAFGLSLDDMQGRFLYDFAPGRWRATSLHRLLEQEIPQQGSVRDFVLDLSTDGEAPLLVNARKVSPDSNREGFVVVSMRREPSGAPSG
jgi:two-component system, chemotaxis family, CheB/CheR fusion protein